jgi:Zn-dependent protease with chaperone function
VTVAAEVRALAARAGIRAPAVQIRPTASVAHVRGARRGPLLVLDPSVAAADRRVLRAVIAHELGHLAAGHNRDVKLRLLGMVAAGLACGVAVLLGTRDVTAAAAAALVPSTVLTLAVLRRLRRHELAADRGAVALLGEKGSTLAALAWLDREHPRVPRRWVRFLDDHPTRHDRVAALGGPDAGLERDELTGRGRRGDAGPGGRHA